MKFALITLTLFLRVNIMLGLPILKVQPVETRQPQARRAGISNFQLPISKNWELEIRY